jgi:predicted ATPase
LLGYPDRAVEALKRADEEATHVQSPVPVCIVIIWGASVLGWIGDWGAVEDRADRLIAYARKYSLGPHIAVGDGLKGAALINQGEIESGVELLRGALAKLKADRYELYVPGLCLALAEGLDLSCRRDEAMAVVNDTISKVEANGGSFDLPELLRMKGTLLMQAGDHAGAKKNLRHSLDMATQQSALSLQLRTAISLARLGGEGRLDQSRERLAGIYRRFSEGFETADLRTAKKLLSEIHPAYSTTS